MIKSISYTPRWEAWPKNDRLKRWCVVDAAAPGTGKPIIADNIRTEANAYLMATSQRLWHIAELIETAYLTGGVEDFHTRLNAISGGNFGDVLGVTLKQARGAV